MNEKTIILGIFLVLAIFYVGYFGFGAFGMHGHAGLFGTRFGWSWLGKLLLVIILLFFIGWIVKKIWG